MARYNKIFLGPAQENLPQVQELPAAADTLPGCLVTIASGEFALAGVATTDKLRIVQDNYLTGGGVNTEIPEGDVTIGMELLDEMLYAARIATGTSIARDAPLTSGANGRWITATGSRPVYGYAEEAYNNTTGSDQLIAIRGAGGHPLS